MSEEVSRIREVTCRLADALGEADYAIIGGVAVGYRSVLRTTRDVDAVLAVPRSSLPPILNRLQEAGFIVDVARVLKELRDDHLSHVQYAATGTRLDLMDALVPSYRQVVRLATWEEIEGHRIRIASAEGLIFLKLLAFRLQDRVDLRSLLAANRGKLKFDIIRDLYTQVGETGDERWQHLERVRAELDAADREA